jgi:hypothetical protein
MWHLRISEAETPEHRQDVAELFTLHFLARIAKLDDPQVMKKELALARETAAYIGFYTDVFMHLAKCVDQEVLYLMQFRYGREKHMYPLFSKALPMLIPGAQLTQVPFLPRHRPDFFVEKDGMIAPVELKIGNATNKAIQQLERYMHVYKAKTGYLIADKLTGKLKQGMTFCTWNSEIQA